jgi:16S rRNA (guanine(1405)-N(7))-methyltransferase
MLELDGVVSAVASSKKYGALCTDTIRRIAAHELATHGNTKTAIKATKRRLHQVYGAFEWDLEYDAAYRQLETAYRTGSESEIRATCRHLMGGHSSTRERLPILDSFYPAVFKVTGPPRSILDMGSGLNPLALPWMDLVSQSGSGRATGARYIALDIDANRVDFLNRYLALTGLEPLARCQDILAHPPDDTADVALLLKMSPTLERQAPGATLWLVERLCTSHVVVSFAIKSLGGREKGMAQHYQRQFVAWAEERQWPTEKLAFETELVFIVTKARPAQSANHVARIALDA